VRHVTGFVIQGHIY